MNELIFDEKKKYTIWINREGNKLTFYNTTKVITNGILISFIDRDGQNQIFDSKMLTQAKEERE